MKVIKVLVSSLLLSMLLPAMTGNAEDKLSIQNSNPVTDQVIITMKKGKELDESEVSGIQQVTEKEISMYVAKIPEGDTLSKFMEELKTDPDVLSVEPDYILQTTYTPNDPLIGSFQYHHQTINSYDAWDRTTGSADVTVAVLDNGFDLYHPELYHSWDNAYSTGSSFEVEDHGTHVAGIIVASMDNYAYGSGVAPNTKLLPIDVFEEPNVAYTSAIIDGIYVAVSQGADIINMSLGGYSWSSSFQNAINYAYEQGVVVIAAAGNDATSQTMYPAGYSNVISVASTDQWDYQSGFSNYGYSVDIAAPGSSILSTVPTSSVGFMSGTSMAAPVVAGVAALIKANEPYLSNSAIESRLYETASDKGTYGYDIVYGHGIVNAAAALHIYDIEQPIVYELNDQSTTVNGYLPQELENGTVTVFTSDGGVIGYLPNYTGWTDFTIPIAPQKAGTLVYVEVSDIYGNYSEHSMSYIYDVTPPSVPTINPVTNLEFNPGYIAVSGTSDLETWVTISNDSEDLGSTYTKEDGTYGLFVPAQPAGTILTIRAHDHSGNWSDSITTEVEDVTPPEIPTVDSVNDQSTVVTGQAEKDETISVYKGNVEVSSGESNADGSFSVTIPKQKAGIYLTVFATDSKNRSGFPAYVTVQDATAPSSPVIDSVTDQSTKLTGKAEAESKIIVRKGTEIIAQGTTEANGVFTISIPKQKLSTKLYVSATDLAGNRSGETEVSVSDGTPPEKPSVDEVSDQSTRVVGTAEASSKIEVHKEGQLLAQGVTSAQGSFSIEIPKQQAGIKLLVTAIDAGSNRSSEMEVVVKDKTAPEKPTVQPVTDFSNSISGTTEANASVEIAVGTNVIGQGTTNGEGKFTVTIPKQPASTKLKVTAIDTAGNRSQESEMIVSDATAPVLSKVSAITNSSTEITGVTEVGATVVLMKGTTKLGQAQADSAGVFKITFLAQSAQTELKLVATDKALNSSEPLSIIVGVQAYSDLKSNHWAFEQIMYLANASIIGGYPDGTFQPNRNTTRAEAARMLATALDLPVVDTPSIFKDVPTTHWANDFIVAAAKAGIFKGNPDGTFNPSGQLTRAEMAILLSTAYDLDANNLAHFSDVKSTHWANRAIAAMYENNLTVGYPDGTYHPSNSTTRAEFSMFLAKALNKDFR